MIARIIRPVARIILLIRSILTWSSRQLELRRAHVQVNQLDLISGVGFPLRAPGSPKVLGLPPRAFTEEASRRANRQFRDATVDTESCMTL